MPLLKNPKLFFWLAIVAVTLLSLLPINAPQELVSGQDKIHHSIVYGALYFLAICAYGFRFSIWGIGAILVLFGLLMEIAQSMIAYRYGDPFDLLANTSGILLVGVAYSMRRRRS